MAFYACNNIGNELVEVSLDHICEFEVLNELRDAFSRTDSNCLHFTRFLFECDDSSLNEQIDRAVKLKHLIRRATYSGGKSIHCIIEFPIEYDSFCKSCYKKIWRELNNLLFDGKADTACSNPARLTRRPNVFRADKSKMQKLIYDDGALLNDKNIIRQIKCNISASYVKEHDNKKPERIFNPCDGKCENYDVIQHYLNTAYPKLTGNGDSSISLFRAVRCCIKYNDSATLEKVLTKAKSEHWSDTELNRLQNNIRNKYV